MLRRTGQNRKPKSAGLVLAAALAFCGSICGQAPVVNFAGRPISDIQISPPNILDSADLAVVQTMKPGETFHPEDAAKAIDSLFATGRFDDIAVEAEPKGAAVSIHFVTRPAWFVGGVTVEGKISTPPNRGQIASTAGLILGAPFRDEEVET